MIRRHLLGLVLAAGFLLGVHNGHIALWHDGAAEPLVFPCRAGLLPRSERLKLEAGIRIENEEQLIRFLEDLLS